MQPKPDGFFVFDPKTQTVYIKFNKMGKVFAINNRQWEYFIRKHCSEVTNMSVKGGTESSHGGISYPPNEKKFDPITWDPTKDLFK